MSNEQITAIAKSLGFCCAKRMLQIMERDKHKRVARVTGLSVSTIRFNRYKLRDGEMKGFKECEPKETT